MYVSAFMGIIHHGRGLYRLEGRRIQLVTSPVYDDDLGQQLLGQVLRLLKIRGDHGTAAMHITCQ